MTAAKKLKDLQVLHSEMLATAVDLGLKVPQALAADIVEPEDPTEEKLATATAAAQAVCDSLDKLIREFRAGLDEKTTEGENTMKKPTAKRAKAAKPASPEKAKAAKPASPEKAKKKAPKKGASAAAKKMAKKSATPKRTGDDAKIVILKKENPFDENTNRWKRAKQIMSAKTVGEAKKGQWYDSWTLRKLQELKVIKVERAAA